MIDTSIWDKDEILDTSIYDGEDSGTSLHEIWTYRPFEEYEIYIGSGNQRIESYDSGNH